MRKKDTHLFMNKKDDIYVMKTVMNETEDICETKTIINFLMKYIVTVTRISKLPHWTARCVPTNFGISKMATLVELLDNL